MLNSSIWPINWAQSIAKTSGQNGLRSNGNKGVFHITKSLRTDALLSDCLMTYLGHSFGDVHLFAEKQSVYSIVPVDWADKNI